MSTKKKESGIDFSKLKEACKVFNEREYKDVKGNIINIKYVANPVPVIIENFMTCCERLPGPVQDALPDDDVLTVMFQEIEEEQKRVLAADQAGKKVETFVVKSEDVGKVEDVLEEKKPEVIEEETTENEAPPPVNKRVVGKKGSVVRDYVEAMIEKGTHTKAVIVDSTLATYPEASKGSVVTMLSDGKNPKYNKFRALIKVDDKGVFSFVE